MNLRGTLVAAAVATLVASGTVLAENADGKDDDAVPIKCGGKNACGGKGACATKENACAGKNACKGKGFDYTKTKEECTAKGGTVLQE